MIKRILTTSALALGVMYANGVTATVHQLGNAVTLKGELTQGAMLIGKTAPNNKIILDNQTINIASNGQFVIGFGRDATLTHTLSVIDKADVKKQFDVTLDKRQYNISRVTGISKKITHPNKKNQQRASLDAKQVRAARAVWSDQVHFGQQFKLPVKGRISGVYGSQRYYNGKAGRPHYGLDIARPTGTVVNAPADGIVRLFVPDMFYSGGTLIIDHGMGVSSTFLHLSAGLVKAGDVVKQGQPVAKIGTTGRSTGPHLDWRMNWLSQRIDPQLLLDQSSK